MEPKFEIKLKVKPHSTMSVSQLETASKSMCKSITTESALNHLFWLEEGQTDYTGYIPILFSLELEVVLVHHLARHPKDLISAPMSEEGSLRSHE